MSVQRKRTLVLGALLVVALGMCLHVSSANAHADYERAEPAADAVVDTAPAQVRIWFTQELFRRQGMNQIEVLDAAGQRVDQDDVTIDDDDRTLMQVTLLPELPDGVYTVRWQSLSAEDGHEGKGEFTFTVGEGAAPGGSAGAAAPQATASPTSPPASTPAVAPTPAPSPTVAPALSPTVAPAPTATTPTQTPGLPCLGGAAPLLLVLGALVTRRRGAHP